MKSNSRNKFKRILSMILVTAMVMGIFPVQPVGVLKAISAGTDPVIQIEDDGTVTVTGETTPGNATFSPEVYTGNAITKNITLKDKDGNPLAKGADYTIAYRDNTNVGTAWITIDYGFSVGVSPDDQNYSGTLTYQFEIQKADISTATVSINDVVYNGEENKAEPVVTFNGTTLVKGRDYTLSYPSANYTDVSGGELKTVTITGAGANFDDTKTKDATYKINKFDLTGASVSLSPAENTWAEDISDPTVSVKKNGTVVNSAWYKVNYPEPYSLGDNDITVVPKTSMAGNITGSASAAYKLNPDTEITDSCIQWSTEPVINSGNYYFKEAGDVKISGVTTDEYKYEITAVSTGSGTANLSAGDVTVDGNVTNLKLTVVKKEKSSDTIKGQNDIAISNIVIDGTEPVIDSVTTAYSNDVVYLDTWVSGIESTTVSATDIGSGLDKVYYYIDGSDKNNATTMSFGDANSIVLNPKLESEKTYKIFVKDKMGHESDEFTETVKSVDSIKPKIKISKKADPQTEEDFIEETDGYVNKEDAENERKTFYLSVVENESGIKYIKKDGNPVLTIPDIVCSGDEDSITTYSFEAEDNVGNKETREFTVTYDIHAPVIENVKLNDQAGESVYTKDNVVISVNITDTIKVGAEDVDQLMEYKLVAKNATTDSTTVAFTGEKALVKDEMTGLFTCTIEIGDGEYLNQKFDIFAKDKAGNISTEEISVEIDKKAPEKPVIQSPTGDGWISSGDVEFVIEVTHDHGNNENHKVLLKCDDGTTTATFDNGIVQTDEKIIRYRIPIEYSVVNKAYTFKAIDELGNESDEASYNLKIDKKAPDGNDIFVSYNSDIDEDKDEDEKTESIGRKKFEEKDKNPTSIFGKQKITVELYVRDEGSGVAEVEYQYGNRKSKTVSASEPNFPITTDGVDKKYSKVTIELRVAEGEDIDGNLKIISITDKVGNTQNSGTKISKLSKEVLFIDNVSPKLKVSYPGYSDEDFPQEKQIFYKKETTSTDECKEIKLVYEEKYYEYNVDVSGNIIRPEIEIKRKQIGADNVFITVSESDIEYVWTDSDDKMETTIKLPFIKNKEVEYTIATSYPDRATNQLEYKNVNSDKFATCKNGTYTSGVFVLDDKAPELHVSLYDVETGKAIIDKNGAVSYGDPIVWNTYDKNDNRLYFNDEVKLQISVDETYFDEKQFKDLLKSSKTISDYGEKEGDIDFENISQDKDGKWICTVDMTAGKNYDVNIAKFKDKAGNTVSAYNEFPKNGKKAGELVTNTTVMTCVDHDLPEAPDIDKKMTTVGFWERIGKTITTGNLQWLSANTQVEFTIELKDETSGLLAPINLSTDKVGGAGTELAISWDPNSKDNYKRTYTATLPQTEKCRYTIGVQAVDILGHKSDERKFNYVYESQTNHNDQKHFKAEKTKEEGNEEENYYRRNVDLKTIVMDKEAGVYSVKLWVAYKDINDKKQTIEIVDKEDISKFGLVEETESYEKSIGVEGDDFILYATMEDNAGNKTGDDDGKKLLGPFYIDKTAPVIEVFFNPETPINGRYFNVVRRATVKITEKNFDEDRTHLYRISKSRGEKEVNVTWRHVGDKHYADVAFDWDDDFDFRVVCMDKAGNQTVKDDIDEFTVDLTAPTYTVTYDNNNVQNGYYYAAGRVATIDVYEHNFDPALVHLNCTAAKGGVMPAISGWRRSGDHSIATVNFSKDGEYTFDIEGMDLANNAFADYAGDRFVIDTTAPTLEIFDIENMSANNGVVMPGVRYSDINYDANATHIAMNGYYNGLIDMSDNGTVTRTATGMEIKLNDFAHTKQMDDLYTMNAVVYDLAGNSSEASVIFSVNRFGSVYTFDEVTTEMLGENGKFYTNVEKDITVIETNVDTLVFKEITVNANGELRTLQEGVDFELSESGTDVSWKQYTYKLFKKTFEVEGSYLVTIYSEDRATNVSDNNTKGKKLEFVVDKTAPSIVVGGVENGGRYRDHKRMITIDVQDNVLTSDVTVILNGKEVIYDASVVSENNGRIMLEAGSANKWQTLSVKARDAAGNEKVMDEIRFLVTSNILVQFYMNKLLFFGVIIGIVVLGGGFYFLIIKRRKKDKKA